MAHARVPEDRRGDVPGLRRAEDPTEVGRDVGAAEGGRPHGGAACEEARRSALRAAPRSLPRAGHRPQGHVPQEGRVDLQKLYYAVGIASAVIVAPLIFMVRAYRASLRHVHQRIDDLKSMTASREELRESVRQIIERSDQRWSDHLKYGDEVLGSLRERLELVQNEVRNGNGKRKRAERRSARLLKSRRRQP